MLEHEFPDVIRVARSDVNQEVIRPTENEELGYFRTVAQLLHEGGDQVPSTWAEPDADERLSWHPEQFGIHIRSELLDSPGFLQCFEP